MSGAEPIEVELALAQGPEYLARAVFFFPAVVTLGNSEEALLQLDDSSLDATSTLLELTEQGAFLLVTEEMELELVTDEQRDTLASLREQGTAVEEDGRWRVELPSGANVVLAVGQANVMLKSRPATPPEEQVKAGGSAPHLVCGRCGADLTLIIASPHALSPCSRCGARNQVHAAGSLESEAELGEAGQESQEAELGAEGNEQRNEETEQGTEATDQGTEATDQGAEATDQGAEATDQGSAVTDLGTGDGEVAASGSYSGLGPEGTEADFPVSTLASSPGHSETDGLSQPGLGPGRQDDPGDFDEEATEPGISSPNLAGRAPMEVSVGGEAIRQLASAPTQLVDSAEAPADEPVPELGAGDEQPAKRSRKKKRRRKSPWTPRLVSLIVAGLLSGAVGLGLVFYAVLFRAADGS